MAGRSTCSLRPSRTSTRAPRRGRAMPWAVAPGPRRHPRWWNRCDFGCSTPGSPWGSSFRLRRTLGAGPQWPPFNRCGLLLFRGEPGVLHPKSHRFHHSKWRLRPGATAQDVLRPRRGARVLLRPARKVVVRWQGGAHAVLDLVEQALVRPAAAGPCHGQLHPALDATQGGGTGATLGVVRRARFGRRAFACDGRLMQASSTGSLPITRYGSCRPRSAAAD